MLVDFLTMSIIYGRKKWLFCALNKQMYLDRKVLYLCLDMKQISMQ